MENENIKVNFNSIVSTSEYCICSACHGLGRVIKVALPKSKYFNYKTLSTRHDDYWLCRECRDKLVEALEWEE